MANKSAEKHVRTSAKKQARNKAVRSEVKTKVSKAEFVILNGDAAAAKVAVTEAVSSLDKAAEKQILHANNVARRKARLVKKLNQVVARSKEEPASKTA